jgi:hypothetical protein
MVGTSFATDLMFGGDARVRGIYKDNATDADGDVDDTTQVWDQRVRLRLDAKIDDVTVNTRLRVSEGEWGLGGPAVGTDTDGDNGADVTVDYSYIVVPIQGTTLTIGRQLASWGNKLYIWDEERERAKLTYKMDNTMVGAFIEKTDENNQADAEGDLDGYSLLATTSFDGGTAGIIGVYQMDNNSDDDAAADGFIVDVVGTYKVSNVSLAGELVVKTGDRYETNDDDGADIGAFIAASMPLEPVTLSLALAYAGDDFDADNDFTPTLLFGLVQANAIMNWSAGADDSAYAVVLGVDYMASDALGLGAKLAYASWSDQGVEADGSSIVEIDAFANYQITASTSWMLGLAYGIPSDMSASDDNIISLAHKLEVKF